MKTSLNLDGLLYSPPAVQMQRDGVYLLVDPAAPNWLSTDEMGARLLRLCDGRRTLDDIGAALGAAAPDREGLVGFLQQAAESGFVANAPDVSPPFRGRAEAIAPGRLEELWIYTNNSCPLRCRHCLVSAGEGTADQLSKEQIERVVDDGLRLGVSRIYFTGGEPLLRRDIFDLASYVLQRCQLVILTSGVLLTEEAADRLSALGKGRLLLQVSLEGPDPATHDLVRGRGSFNRAVAGLQRLLTRGLSPIVSTTIAAQNRQRAAEMVHFLSSLGVRGHHLLWLHNRGRLRDSLGDLGVSGEEVAEAMAEVRQAALDLPIVVDNHESLRARVRGKRGHKYDLCNCGFSMLSVNSDGRVYPCPALSGAAEFDCGSILDHPLQEIWLDSSVACWVRGNSVQKRVGCSTCWLKFFCGGGCFAQSYFDYEVKTGAGCIMAPDPYCAAYRHGLEGILWELARPVDGVRRGRGATPTIYAAMSNELPNCAAGAEKVLDGAFSVGTYHCSCVLAVDAQSRKMGAAC